MYELRSYTAVPGKMDQLLERFRNHTDPLFADYGIESLGYWINSENPDQLIYLLRHNSDPEQNWEKFRVDPRWLKARDESQQDGPLTVSIDSVYLSPTDFSKLS